MRHDDRASAGATSSATGVAAAFSDIDERLANARHRISLAALALIRGAPDADRQVSAVITQIDIVRRLVRALEYQAKQVSGAHPDPLRAFEAAETPEAAGE